MEKRKMPPKVNWNSEPRRTTCWSQSQMEKALLAEKMFDLQARLSSATAAKNNDGMLAAPSKRRSEMPVCISTTPGKVKSTPGKVKSKPGKVKSALARKTRVTAGRGESVKCPCIPCAALARRSEASSAASAREADFALPPSTSHWWADRGNNSPCPMLKSACSPGDNHLVHCRQSAALKSDESSAYYLTPITSDRAFDTGAICEIEEDVQDEIEEDVQDDTSLGFTLAAVFGNGHRGKSLKKKGRLKRSKQATSGKKTLGHVFQIKTTLRDQAEKLQKLTTRFFCSLSFLSKESERSQHKERHRSSDPGSDNSLTVDRLRSGDNREDTYEGNDCRSMSVEELYACLEPRGQQMLAKIRRKTKPDGRQLRHVTNEKFVTGLQ